MKQTICSFSLHFLEQLFLINRSSLFLYCGIVYTIERTKKIAEEREPENESEKSGAASQNSGITPITG
jgi:hypothetical protein